MLIVRGTEPIAMGAVFAADRGRLLGGQHDAKRPLWTVTCSIPVSYSSQGFEQNYWRGG
jgi:hypothetical protein